MKVSAKRINVMTQLQASVKNKTGTGSVPLTLLPLQADASCQVLLLHSAPLKEHHSRLWSDEWILPHSSVQGIRIPAQTRH